MANEEEYPYEEQFAQQLLLLELSDTQDVQNLNQGKSNRLGDITKVISSTQESKEEAFSRVNDWLQNWDSSCPAPSKRRHLPEEGECEDEFVHQMKLLKLSDTEDKGSSHFQNDLNLNQGKSNRLGDITKVISSTQKSKEEDLSGVNDTLRNWDSSCSGSSKRRRLPKEGECHSVELKKLKYQDIIGPENSQHPAPPEPPVDSLKLCTENAKKERVCKKIQFNQMESATSSSTSTVDIQEQRPPTRRENYKY